MMTSEDAVWAKEMSYWNLKDGRALENVQLVTN